MTGLVLTGMTDVGLLCVQAQLASLLFALQPAAAHQSSSNMRLPPLSIKWHDVFSYNITALARKAGARSYLAHFCHAVCARHRLPYLCSSAHLTSPLLLPRIKLPAPPSSSRRLAYLHHCLKAMARPAGAGGGRKTHPHCPLHYSLRTEEKNISSSPPPEKNTV